MIRLSVLAAGLLLPVLAAAQPLVPGQNHAGCVDGRRDGRQDLREAGRDRREATRDLAQADRPGEAREATRDRREAQRDAVDARQDRRDPC
jgi:Spy/CpxP family protein refolding chaperone